jgi:16S rRNA (guanine1516-N2)-methyltransferase
MQLALTTTLQAQGPLRFEAREAAKRHGLPLLEREEWSLPELCRRTGVEALVVLGGGGVSLFFDGAEHRYHPGMGALRAKRLALGEGATAEPFLAAMELKAADHVLDCTFGLGGDALVAAEAVGPGGRVVGLEASPVLATWTAEGLRRLPLAAARRIEVHCQEHGAFLRSLPDRSFDVVFFDPMVRRALAQAPSFDVVRRFGSPSPLDPAALAEARRVARRWVVVRDGAPGRDLARLGLCPLPSRRRAERLYARVSRTEEPRP